MLRRLLLGLFEGLAIGAALGVGAALGLGLRAPGSVLGAVLGAGTGVVVGLIAGRPVWARDAKTEALLKAAVGGAGGVALSLAAGHWLKIPLDLSAFRLGAGPAGALSAVVLPLLAIVLALLFELDHDGAMQPGTRLARSSSRKRRLRAETRPNPAALDEAELEHPEQDESRLRKR
jgi:hypothetical protein